MKRLFKKEQILTIPNLLTVIRLFMIPIIIYLYCGKKNYYGAGLMVLLSGLTDVADGIIARKLHQVSEWGKIIDPIADKLTQGALLLCLVTKYALMLPMLVLFVVKELLMAICGLLAIHRVGSVNSSQWFGKLSTVTLYVCMMILFFFPQIGELGGNGLILLCAGTSVLSLVGYLRFYKRLFATQKEVC